MSQSYPPPGYGGQPGAGGQPGGQQPGYGAQPGWQQPAPPPPAWQQQPGYAPYPPPPPGATGRLRGRIPLRLALIFGVLGIALVVIGAVLGFSNTRSDVDGFQRISFASETHTVHFTRVGKYVAYFETPSNGDHTAYVQMAITNAAGKHLQLGRYGGASHSSHVDYNIHGHHGEALFTFTIGQPGTYQVAIRATGAPPGADMAFGKSIATGLALGIGLLIPGILLVVAAIILLIVGLVRRHSHKRQIELASRGGPPPGSDGSLWGPHTGGWTPGR